jgi:hypothetical protein
MIAPRVGLLIEGGITFARDCEAKHMAMIEMRIEVFMLKDCEQ